MSDAEHNYPTQERERLWGHVKGDDVPNGVNQCDGTPEESVSLAPFRHLAGAQNVHLSPPCSAQGEDFPCLAFEGVFIVFQDAIPKMNQS